MPETTYPSCDRRRKRSRPIHPIVLQPARLVPLTPDQEQAALVVLAALLIPTDEGGDE